MGLDMYAYAVPKKFAKGDFEINEEFFNSNEGDKYFAYWRKRSYLHDWFFDKYKEKGGKESAGDFNCIPVRLTLADLDELKQALLSDDEFVDHYYYRGYFADSLYKYDLEFVERAKEAINDGFDVYYNSWW